MAAIESLEVSDPPILWRALGFAIEGDACRIDGVVIRLGGSGEGVTGWSLSEAVPLPELPVAEPAAGPVTSSPIHPNGVEGIDHVVVSTPDLDRTVAAFEEAGLPLRRVRHIGTDERPLAQAFFKLGAVIVEVVGPPGRPAPGAARFYGLAFTVADLDATAAFLGLRLRPPRDAVQAGRRIATLDRSAGSTVPMAFMSRRA